MIYYVDTDFINKIISFDLIDEFLSAYSITTIDLRIIQHEKVKTKNLIDSSPISQDKKDSYKKFIDSIKTISTPSAFNYSFIQKIQSINGIDSGERTLLSYLNLDKSAFCLTADRRFLTAVINNKSISELIKTVKNRVLIIEQSLIKIVEVHSFLVIKEKLFNGKWCDGYFEIILSNTHITEDGFMELLEDRCKDFKEILYKEEK